MAPEDDRERSWQIGPEGLLLKDAVVSFQRYRCPAGAIIPKAPSSWGVLPVAAGRKRPLLAVPAGEAFWIGILIDAPRQIELSISVQLTDGAVVPLAGFAQRGAFWIDGVPRVDGAFDALCRTIASGLILASGSETIHIDLASVEDFVAQTGSEPPVPFNPDAAYRGWKLP